MASTTISSGLKKGKVTQIIGPVVDIDFGEGVVLPPIYNAVHIKMGAQAKRRDDDHRGSGEASGAGQGSRDQHGAD